MTADWPTIDRTPSPAAPTWWTRWRRDVLTFALMIVVVALAVWGITTWRASVAAKERQQVETARVLCQSPELWRTPACRDID